MVAQLQPWAQKVAEQSKSTSFGIHARVLGIGYNSALATQKKLAAPACWKDLIKPGYAGEVHIADPNATGSTYFAMATMAQLFGEDDAFKYLKAMYKAPPPPAKTGRGAADAKAATPKGAPSAQSGGTTLAQGRRQDGCPRCKRSESVASGRQRDRGHRLRRRYRRRSGGRRARQGRYAVRRNDLRGRRAFDRERRKKPRQREEVRRLGARREGQALAAKAKVYVYPANTAVAASPLAPKFGEIKFINHDDARSEKSAPRRQLIDRWAREFGTAAP